MLIYILIVFAVLVIFIFHHGLELDFYINDGAFTLAVYYVLLGNFRVMEIKRIKFKKRKQKRKIDINLIKSLRGSLEIAYSINVLNLNAATAPAIGSVCTLLESVDTASNIKVTQTISYVLDGFHLNIKLHTSALNLLLSYISYRKNYK